MEEDRVLRNQRNLLSERFQSGPSDVLAIDENAAVMQGIEAKNQVNEGRLTGSREANQPHLFAALDLELLVFKELPFAIVEGDILEDNFSRRDPGATAWGRSLRSDGLRITE